MKVYKEQKTRWLVFPEMMCVFFITTFTMLRMENLVSFTFAISFILIACACVERVVSGRANTPLFWLIVLSSLSVVFNLLSSGSAITGFNYYKKLIMFVTSALFFYYCSRVELKRKEITYVKIFMFITANLLPISYYVLGNNMKIAHLITINYTNPNFTGMWLLTSIVVLIYFFFLFKKLPIKLLVILLITIEVRLLFLNNTRSCIIALTYFAVMMVLGFYRKRHNITKFEMIIYIILPLIIGIIYLHIVQNVSFISRFDFMVSEGKSLASRFDIWNKAVEQIKNHPIVGNYWGISDGTGQSQLHNTAFDVMASYGIPVYCIYIWVMLKSTLWICDNDNNIQSYISMIGFLSIWVSGAFEAALVAGSMGLSIFTGMLLVVSKNDYIETNDNDGFR